MNIALAMVICLLPLGAAAEIYKSVDSEGNVVFSDQPTPSAKKIPEHLTPTYSPATLPATTPPHAASYYTALRILKPVPGEQLRDAAGILSVDLEAVPPLKIQEGHSLVVAVDGNNLAGHDGTTQLTISNLAPGAHTLKAQIRDATGQVLFSSGVITFHMQRPAGNPGVNETAAPSHAR